MLTPVCLAWVGEVREGFLEEAQGLQQGQGLGAGHSRCKDPGARRSPAFLLTAPHPQLSPS